MILFNWIKKHEETQEPPIQKPQGTTEGKTKSFFKIMIVIGLIGLIISVSWLYYGSEDDDKRDIGYVLIILLGATCIGPIFLFFGWFFGDPFQRAKIKRTMFKKNYGIVNFVSKGARIMSSIKNFDGDLLFVNEGVWILERNKVYMQERNDGTLGTMAQFPILPEHINSVIGVPVIFLDVDTMRPLGFHKETGDANPIDLASTIKGYIMNQLAKNMFFKKTFTILAIITIIMIGMNMAITYQAYDILKKYDEFLPKLTALADNMDKMLLAAQQPSNVVQGAG